MLLDEYSGQFEPELDLPDLSRRALAVLGREWMLHGHLQDRVGMPLVHAGRPREVMQAVAIDEWMGASPVYTGRMQRALGFSGDDVPTIFKGIQLDIGAPHQFLDFRCRVIDASHGEFWLAHCGALMDVEPMGTEYVQGMCHDIEDPTFDATAVATNPRARIRPLHRPPRVPADRTPHCHWTVEIDDRNEAVAPHPNVAVLERSRIATIPVSAPPADREPGGWADYGGPFDPDFALEDLSHRALVVSLQELAVQSHLLLRSFLLVVSRRLGEQEAAAMGPRVFAGLAGLTAQRLRSAMRIEGDDATAVAKVLQLHPIFYPRTYVKTSVEVTDDATVRFAIEPCPALEEGDGLTWFARLGADADRGLGSIVQAVNPRAVCRRSSRRPGERFAYEIVIDPDAPPAPEIGEVGLAKISTGATFVFIARRPVRA